MNISGVGTKAEAIDSNGNHISRTIYNTNNTKDITIFDPYNKHDYTTYTNHCDVNSQNTTAVIGYDDGGRSFTVNDAYNESPWAAYNKRYNADGIKISRYTASDDGAGKMENCTRGLTSPNIPDHIDYFK